MSFPAAWTLDWSSTNHERADGHTRCTEAQLLATSRPPLADLRLCSQAYLYQHCWENKEGNHSDSPYCRTPGIKGASVATHCVNHSALLFSKISCSPTKAKLPWEPPQPSPGRCTLGPDTERETAVLTHRHTHMYTHRHTHVYTHKHTHVHTHTHT